jgi:hypothetical protein
MTKAAEYLAGLLKNEERSTKPHEMSRTEGPVRVVSCVSWIAFITFAALAL